jgi:hypothetical protein
VYLFVVYVFHDQIPAAEMQVDVIVIEDDTTISDDLSQTEGKEKVRLCSYIPVAVISQDDVNTALDNGYYSESEWDEAYPSPPADPNAVPVPTWGNLPVVVYISPYRDTDYDPWGDDDDWYVLAPRDEVPEKHDMNDDAEK